MRRIVCLGVILALAAAGAGRAEEKSESKQVIDKAVKAVGGEDKLAKVKAFTFKMKGKFYGMGEGIDYSGEVAVQLPDKSRVKIDGDLNGTKVTFFEQVVNGDKVWLKEFMKETEEVKNKDKLAEVKETIFADRVTSLYPLVKEKEFKLEPLGEVKVDDKPAIGVRVSLKGHRDINLFFSKESGLLVKSERPVKDEMTDKEVTQETLYSDYKEVDGVKHAMKLVINRDGKKYVDAAVSDLEIKDKLDDKDFAKP
jgi:hypothetical protein